MLKTYTQKAVAQKLGVTPSYVSLIVNGRRNASWNLAKKIALLTTSPPNIWVDGDLTPKRRLALLNAELKGLPDA